MSFSSIFNSDSFSLSVAILAGGQGIRMGGVKKGRLYIDGKPIIERVVEKVYQLSDDILIVADRERVDSRCFGLLKGYKNLRFVEDVVSGIGPLGGLYTALLFSIYRYTFVCAADMPFVNIKIVKRMVGYLRSRGTEESACRIEDICRAVVPVWREEETGRELMEPLFSIYSKELIAELESHMFSRFSKVKEDKEGIYKRGDFNKGYSIHRFIGAIGNCCFLPVSDAERVSFTNINTFEDYIRYKESRKSPRGDI